jgi:hypothetical protein
MPREDFLMVPMPAQITVSASPPASKNTSAPAGTVAPRRYSIGLCAALRARVWVSSKRAPQPPLG